ncbi:MAG: TlpA family protein disulfide reductase [Solirubrobacteraceae bacterium]
MSDPPGPGSGKPPADDDPPRSPDPPPLTRLDPDRARPAARTPEAGDPVRPPAKVDTRRYRWMIGIFGLTIVIAVSIYQFARNGIATTGVPSGQRLHLFAAPRANTTLVGDANLNPPCTLARHDPRALNLCLILHRRALVLAFFVIGSTDCENQVNALQQLSSRFPAARVQFAAVAVNANQSDVAALIRSHHWTIPVAYDRDGSIGSLYGVAICPMVELARRGGIVSDRLIGDRWQTSAQLRPRVQALLNAGGTQP